MHILNRTESQLDHLARAGDMHESDCFDMIYSPTDQRLVVVCVRNGVHACGYCLEEFIDEPRDGRRPIEFNPPNGQGTRLLIHAKCVEACARFRPNLVREREQGHQARRFATRALKPFLSQKTT